MMLVLATCFVGHKDVRPLGNVHDHPYCDHVFTRQGTAPGAPLRTSLQVCGEPLVDWEVVGEEAAS